MYDVHSKQRVLDKFRWVLGAGGEQRNKREEQIHLELEVVDDDIRVISNFSRGKKVGGVEVRKGLETA